MLGAARQALLPRWAKPSPLQSRQAAQTPTPGLLLTTFQMCDRRRKHTLMLLLTTLETHDRQRKHYFMMPLLGHPPW